MKTDLRYSTKMCFATFPFPNGSRNQLQPIGARFHSKRDEVLKERGWGLTKLTNATNDPNCHDQEIRAMRALVEELDQTVIEAYGWNDVHLNHGFHNVVYLPISKNPRYTIAESSRVEILDRLTQLNHARLIGSE